MKWARIGKWLGLIVAIIPQIIQIIGTLTNNGTPPMPQEVANGASFIGGSVFAAGMGKESADNLNLTKLNVAAEPHSIPLSEQPAAVKKMEAGEKV